MAGPPPLTGLSEEERAEALQRFHLLRPFLEGGVPLARLAAEQGLALRTARRWVRQYRLHGLAGLARKPRTDRGDHRRLTQELQLLVEGLALQRPPPTVAFVHRQVAVVAAAHGWPVPSYACVYDVIQRLDPGLVMLAHEGSKAYRETFDMLHRREASQANAIWQADHTPLDIWLLDPAGQPARPWLTIIMDDYSRAIAGYFLGFQAPSILNTALALRQAIWRKADPQWHVCGIPDVFYTDHGSDFTSRHLEQVAVDLDMQLIFSTPGMPRGRGRIERFYETVNQRFICGVPGYTPPKTPLAEPKLALAAFEAQFRSFLLEAHPLSLHSVCRELPQALSESGGLFSRLHFSLEKLDLLLLTVSKTRRVQQDGIRIQGLR